MYSALSLHLHTRFNLEANLDADVLQVFLSDSCSAQRDC